MTKREVQSMFSNSIEVLDSLITEYQERLNIESQQQMPQSNEDVQMMFEGFYNRLKFMLQIACEKIEQTPVTFQRVYEIIKVQEQLKSQKTKNVIDYDDCLFPENKANKVEVKAKNASTDEDLYQLVVEMKTQAQEDKLKIISLQKTLSQGQKKIKQLQSRLKKANQQIQSKQIKIVQLSQQLVGMKDQNDKLVEEIKQKSQKISELQEKQQNSAIQTKLKEEKLKRLQLIESMYDTVKMQKNAEQQKCKNLEQNLSKEKNQRQLIQQKLNDFQEQIKKLTQENKKLRNIIAKKLAFIQERSLINDKQNLNTNQYHINSQDSKSQKNDAEKFFRSIVQSLLKDQKLLSSKVEDQLKIFIKNFIKKQALLSKSMTQSR